MFQNSVKRYQDKFSLGDMKGPGYSVNGLLYVPAGYGHKILPATPVLWDKVRRRFTPAANSAGAIPAVGLICNRKNRVRMEYENDDPVDVMVHGIIIATAGNAVGFFDRVEYQVDDAQWDQVAAPAAYDAKVNLGALRSLSREGIAAGDLFELSIGLTR